MRVALIFSAATYLILETNKHFFLENESLGAVFIVTAALSGFSYYFAALYYWARSNFNKKSAKLVALCILLTPVLFVGQSIFHILFVEKKLFISDNRNK